MIGIFLFFECFLMYDAFFMAAHADIFNLQKRAQLLKAIRSFFDVPKCDGSW